MDARTEELLVQWLRDCIDYARKRGLTLERLYALLREVLPSDPVEPAASLPGPPLAAPEPLSAWREWLRRHV